MLHKEFKNDQQHKEVKIDKELFIQLAQQEIKKDNLGTQENLDLITEFAQYAMSFSEKLAQENDLYLTHYEADSLYRESQHSKDQSTWKQTFQYIRNSILSITSLIHLNNKKMNTDGESSFVMQHHPYTWILTNALITLIEAEIPTHDNRYLLLQKPEYALEIAKGFALLKKENLTSQENFKFVVQMVSQENFKFSFGGWDNAILIAGGLIELIKNNLDTPSNRTLLIQNTQSSKNIRKGLEKLNEAKLATQENFLLLLQTPQCAGDIADGLIALSKTDINTPQNRNFVSQQGQYARSMVNGIVHLAEAKLDTEENRLLLIKRRENAYHLGYAIEQLNLAKLANQENFLILVNLCEKLEERDFNYNLPSAIRILNQHQLTTMENLTFLFKNTECLKPLNDIEYKINTFPLSQDEFNLFSVHKQYAGDVIIAFRWLNCAGLDNPQNRALVSKHAEHCSQIAAIEQLIEMEMASQENFDFLMKYPEHFNSIALTLILLNDAKLDTENNRKLLVEKVNTIFLIRESFEKLFNSNLATQENFNNLIQYRDKLFKIFETLWHRDLTQELFDFYINNQEHAADVMYAIDQLHREHSEVELDTPANRELLYKSKEHCGQIAEALILLHRFLLRKDFSIATQENFDFIMKFPAHAENIAALLFELNYHKLDTEKNRALLFQDLRYIDFLEKLFSKLSSNDLATQDNLNQLIKYKEYSEDISEILSKKKTLTQDEFNLVMNNRNLSFRVTNKALFESGISLKFFGKGNLNLKNHIMSFLPKPHLK